MGNYRRHRTIESDLMGFPVIDKGINSKKKGDKNELVACKWLEKWTGEKFARVPRSGGLRWKQNSSVCGDVVCENENFKFAFSVETKHLKDISLTAGKLRKDSKVFTIWKQASEDSSRASKIPMLMLRKNGMSVGDYYIVFDADTVRKFNKPELEIEYEFYGLTLDGVEIFGYTSFYILEKIPYSLFVT